MQNLAGRTILVTGAAAGLGAAYARYLAAQRADLVLSDIDGGIAAVAADIAKEHGVRCEAVAGDIADPATSQRMTEAALGLGGRVDGAINNAGVGLRRPFEELIPDDFRRIMEIHFFGTLHLCRAVWPHMREAGYGRIVNTISRSIYGLSDWSTYISAKGAVFGLSRALAVEGEPLGIAVNMIAPSAGTNIGRNAGARVTEGDVDEKRSAIPAHQVAPVLAWLVHPDCAVTGKCYSSAAGHVAQLQLGSTEGVQTEGDSLDELAAAMADSRMSSGFVEETSVASSAAASKAMRAWT